MNELIIQILEHQGIDPNAIPSVGGDEGNQTTFQILEAAIAGALDDIEDA